jgi:hypothetical protein
MKGNEGVRGARSLWRLYPAFAVAAVLSGCVTTASSPPLSDLATAGGPPKGMARIVVVRGEQTSLMLRFRDFPVKLDGEPLGELAIGRFAYLDRPGGAHQLSAEICCISGVTRRDFTATPGRTYFFRASLDEKVNDIGATTMISPIAGAIASTTTYNDRQGPINLTPISEAEAKAIAAGQQTR